MMKDKPDRELWAPEKYSRASHQSLGEGEECATTEKSQQTLDFSIGFHYHKSGKAQTDKTESGQGSGWTGTSVRTRLNFKAAFYMKVDLISRVTDGAAIAVEALCRAAKHAISVTRLSYLIRP